MSIIGDRDRDEEEYNNYYDTQYYVPDDDTNICELEDEKLKEYMNHCTLEQNPESFKLILEEIYHRNLQVADIINKTDVYDIYFSTLIHCLVFLTGNLSGGNELKWSFYGDHYSIPDSLGVEILNLLVALGGNLNTQNYYFDTVFDFRDYNNFGYTLMARKDNEQLIDRITWLYHNHDPDDHKFVGFN